MDSNLNKLVLQEKVRQGNCDMFSDQNWRIICIYMYIYIYIYLYIYIIIYVYIIYRCCIYVQNIYTYAICAVVGSTTKNLQDIGSPASPTLDRGSIHKKHNSTDAQKTSATNYASVLPQFCCSPAESRRFWGRLGWVGDVWIFLGCAPGWANVSEYLVKGKWWYMVKTPWLDPTGSDSQTWPL